MDRRNFLFKSVVYGIGIAGAASIIESCTKTNSSSEGPPANFTLDLSQSSNASLNAVGGSETSNGIIVVNTGSSYIAVSQTCTHQGCAVNYNKNGNNFICPCHGGTYDINGNVTGGPPPAPLKKYNVTKSGNLLTIAG